MTTQSTTSTAYTTVELLTLAGPEYRRVSAASPRPATLDEIPIIDLCGMNPTAEEKARISSAVRTAATGSGFFYIRNHGISQEVIEGALQQAKAFFSQPDEEKMRVWNRKRKLGNGYSPIGSGQINRSETKDAKEGFQFRYQPEYDPLQPTLQASDAAGPPPQGDEWIWEQTSHLAGFKEATLTWWQHCLSLARGLVRIFALALDLPEDYFDNAITHPGSDGLYIHYPGRTAANQGGAGGTGTPGGQGSDEKEVDAVGIGSHTDMQCFTLLWQDMSGGLQVLSAQDEWIEATPIEGTIVVNIADFLQRLSNDRFRSTVHRVYNRRPASRYSMPFFFGFNYDAVCSVVPTCVDEEHPARYEPISCGKWRDERMALATAKRTG